MIIVVIHTEDSKNRYKTTSSFAGVTSHIYNEETEKLSILLKGENILLSSIYVYALFSDNGTEVLKVTLGEDDD